MKFKVIDTKNGKKYSVEEVELSSRRKARTLDEECDCEKMAMATDAKEEVDLEGALTDKEIKALKKLAKYADDLVAVFEAEEDDKDLKKLEKEEAKEDKEAKKDKEEAEPKGKAADDEFGEDEDLGLEEDEDDEEVVDIEEDDEVVTDSEPSIKDSKKSFGSIESKNSVVDSDDESDEIAEAWKAYYEKAKQR